MSHALTAQDLFSEMKRMPSTERHEQVFGHLQHEPLSAFEAAEYLEVSLPTLRRYVQANKLRPCHTVGRNQMFSAEDLRVYKRARR